MITIDVQLHQTLSGNHSLRLKKLTRDQLHKEILYNIAMEVAMFLQGEIVDYKGGGGRGEGGGVEYVAT